MKKFEQSFLEHLSESMRTNPESVVRPVSTEMWDKIKELVEGVDVDLDKPLEDDE